MHDPHPRYFLSYAHRDQPFAERLARDLHGLDQDVFFDRGGIVAGSDWTRTIQSALDGCSCIIVVLSPHAVASDNVLDETRYARDHGKRVLPLLRQECEIPFWLWRIQYVDFQGVYEQAFEGLLGELRRAPRAPILDVSPKSAAMDVRRLASSRNLVVCFDHQLHPTFRLNSNAFAVARMARSVSDRQIVYYDPGVEMLGGAGAWSELRYALRTYLRVWLGHGISEHVEHAYAFLMETYRTGDRVFLFGTSAGGLMATVLAEAMAVFGLLDKAGAVVVPYAVRGLDRVTESEATQFKSALSRDIEPHFFGMWDCVRVHGAFRRGRGEMRLSPRIPLAYHALAIDERRRSFRPLLWAHQPASGQTIEQMWFAGSHADVGGGYAERGLSDIALSWMVDKANAAGMLFDAAEVERLAPDPLAAMHDSLIGPWRALGSSLRTICGSALVHPSVRERHQRLGYSPRNLYS